MCERPPVLRRASARGMRAAALAPLLAVSAPALAQDAPEPEPWPEVYYNPQPAEGDLVLPMPCGGAMVFRRVDTPVDGPLDDRRVLLGASDESRGYAEGPVFADIAGGFTDPDGSGRHYWIGKYEVTAAQYAALEECPELTPAMRLPATAVTWADAVAFADAYTAWLLANAPEALPQVDGVSGFIRLPTEAEWDFAARGGVAIRMEEFRGRTFPMPDGMPEYVWFQGSRSANNRLQFTGLLQPNPLGLHDILGNVDEIVLDPFHLNRGGRWHGQAGGFVVRGGNYLTSAQDIRTSYRQEIAHFRNGAPNRVRTIGFRLAISAPVLTSRERLAEIDAAWRAQAEEILEPVPSPDEDPLAALERLIAEREDAALALATERVIAELRAQTDIRAGASDRLARALLRLGAGFGVEVNAAATVVALKDEIYQAFAAAGVDPQQVSAAADSLASERQALEEALGAYVDNAIIAAENIPAETLEAQLAILREELAASGRSDILPFADAFAAHVAELRERGEADRAAWLAALME
jgi:hypothetical protein